MLPQSGETIIGFRWNELLKRLNILRLERPKYKKQQIKTKTLGELLAGYMLDREKPISSMFNPPRSIILGCVYVCQREGCKNGLWQLLKHWPLQKTTDTENRLLKKKKIYCVHRHWARTLPVHRQQQRIPAFIINFDVQPNVIMYGWLLDLVLEI